jgi:hypothetical protein
MSPREIFALPEFQFDPSSFSLYLPYSATPLQLDTPLAIERGMAFEAQRDGLYGGGT